MGQEGTGNPQLHVGGGNMVCKMTTGHPTSPCVGLGVPALATGRGRRRHFLALPSGRAGRGDPAARPGGPGAPWPLVTPGRCRWWWGEDWGSWGGPWGAVWSLTPLSLLRSPSYSPSPVKKKKKKNSKKRKRNRYFFACENVIPCWQGSLGGSDEGWGT